MSLRDKVRDPLHPWVDGVGSGGGSVVIGPDLGGSLGTPTAVERMAEDAVPESVSP